MEGGPEIQEDGRVIIFRQDFAAVGVVAP